MVAHTLVLVLVLICLVVFLLLLKLQQAAAAGGLVAVEECDAENYSPPVGHYLSFCWFSPTPLANSGDQLKVWSATTT